MIETYSAALPQSAYRASGGECVVFLLCLTPAGPLPEYPNPTWPLNLI